MPPRFTASRNADPRFGLIGLLLYAGIFLVLALLTQEFSGAYKGDLNVTADESAHFTSSAMIHDYLLGGNLTSPLKFSLDYYNHFPRVAIGHWPPLFHFLQALVFMATGTSVPGAMIFQALIAAGACATVAAIIARRTTWVVGLCSGTAMLATAQFMFSFNTIMLDNFVGLLILLAALAWSAYARTGSLAWSTVFGLSAAAAILTKGNAYGLAFLPIVHAILSRRLDLLLSIRTYISAVIVMILTIPWYALTYQMASDGFRYDWGLGYTHAALTAFAGAMPGLLGNIGLIAFLLAAGVIGRSAWLGRRDETALSCLAASIGIFAFICLVPADISPRYLGDLFPCAFLTAVLGLDPLLQRTLPSIGPFGRMAALSGILILNATLAFNLPYRATFKMDAVTDAILASGSDNPLVLVCANARAEGALIAAFAEKDRARSHFVIRGTKAVASSDFMGRGYKLRFDNIADLKRWIEDTKIGWLVIVDVPLLPGMAHMDQMAELEATHPARWNLIAEQKTDISDARIFRLPGGSPTEAEIENLLKQIALTTIVRDN
jgi:hypothetical protein